MELRGRFSSSSLAVLVAAAAGCAAVQQAGEANRSAPGSAANGVFTPGRPGAEAYGPAGAYACPAGGANKILDADVAEMAAESKRPAPRPDGRLCAIADTFLGWSGQGAVPESVQGFVAWYFGSPVPNLRVVTATIDSEDPRVVAQRVLDPISQFAANAEAPRYGFVTQRLSKSRDRRSATASSGSEAQGSSRVVVVMQDAGLELQPLPRKLASGGTAPLKGTLAGEYEKPTVLVADPSGKLETFGPAQGKEVAADLKCGPKDGTLLVEVRAERGGSPASVARFPVACGTTPATSAAIPPPPASDAAQAERSMLETMNQVRAGVALPALQWDDAVAKVARQASAAQRDSSAGAGAAVDFDVVGKLKAADVISPLVLLNPAASRSPAEAQWRLSTSPVHRSNVLNPAATHAGVGIAETRDQEGSIYYVTQLLVRELPPIDVEAMRGKVREAVAQRRKDARADPVTPDPLLDDVAQKYAKVMADAKGKPSEDQLSAVVAPLYKAMRTVSVVAGTKLEPLEIVEEPGAVAAGKVVGVGVAQGFNPVLGKNAVYVTILVGARK
jgi:uncharacterized protein YkwD